MEMKLCDVKKNRAYKVLNILIQDKQVLEKLNNFGLNIGNYVMVVRSNFFKRTYVISINGMRYIIDKSICEKIFVKAL